ncbi:DUF2059 domain-containing protein [Pedobacter sp. UBA4863]|uniref:DUF2059 domain-containing protein n=1 Tax=Pedobacter sp. UBA4863 TaxID=1947060 RepID=UPI0026009E00|nr:DUF2059 domain-containing protein [Pedobacter sp. UBA4863]
MKKLLVAMLIAFPGLAFSQTAQHIKAGEEFIEVSGVKASFDGIIGTMLNAQKGTVPEQYREKFVEVMTAFMKKYFNYEVLKPRLGKMYAEEFTEVELKELTKFYSSATGKKFASKLAGLTQKGAEMGKKVMEENKPELERMIKEAFAQ